VIGWLKPKTVPKYYVDVSERTIWTWIKEENLRHIKVRGTVLIKKIWIDEFLERHEVSSRNELEGIVDEVMEGLK
jgi:excisionase family DNA binding protein